MNTNTATETVTEYVIPRGQYRQGETYTVTTGRTAAGSEYRISSRSSHAISGYVREASGTYSRTIRRNIPADQVLTDLAHFEQFGALSQLQAFVEAF